MTVNKHIEIDTISPMYIYPDNLKAKLSKIRKKEAVEDDKIKDFLDMVAPGIIKFSTDHFICGNTFRSVWALREYPTSTSEQAILKHLGEKDGVTCASIPGR